MNIKKTFKNISLTFFFLAFATILGYIVRILFARNLPAEQYGLFYSLIGFFGFFAIFRSMGTVQALIHFIPKYVKEKDLKRFKYALTSVFFFQLALGFILSAVFFIFADQIASWFFHMQGISNLIRIHSITFFAIGFAELFSGIFNGLQKPHLASLYEPLRLTFITISSAILISLGLFNINSLILFWLFGYIFMIAIYVILFLETFKKIKAVQFERFHDVISDLKKYSIPLMFGVAAEMIMSKSDVLLLTFLRGAEQVAYYEIAFPIASMLLLIMGPFSFVLFPAVSKLFFDKQKEKIKEILQFSYNSGLFILVPLFILILVYPQFIIKLLFSEKYVQAAFATQIFSIGTLFLVFSQINFSILSGIGEIKKKTNILYLAAIVNIAINLLLVPKLGYLGAIIATSVGYFLLWLLSYFVCTKEIAKFKIHFKSLLKILFSSAILLISVVILRQLMNLNAYLEASIAFLVGLIIYSFVGIFVLKIINLDTLRSLIQQIRK